MHRAYSVLFFCCCCLWHCEGNVAEPCTESHIRAVIVSYSNTLYDASRLHFYAVPTEGRGE